LVPGNDFFSSISQINHSNPNSDLRKTDGKEALQIEADKKSGDENSFKELLKKLRNKAQLQTEPHKKNDGPQKNRMSNKAKKPLLLKQTARRRKTGKSDQQSLDELVTGFSVAVMRQKTAAGDNVQISKESNASKGIKGDKGIESKSVILKNPSKLTGDDKGIPRIHVSTTDKSAIESIPVEQNGNKEVNAESERDTSHDLVKNALEKNIEKQTTLKGTVESAAEPVHFAAYNKDSKSINDKKNRSQSEKAKVKISVDDRRIKTNRIKADVKMKSADTSLRENNIVEFTLQTEEGETGGNRTGLKLVRADQFSSSGELYDNGKTGNSDFGTNLMSILREKGNGAIVKNARIVLKDAHSGEIRLILKPEELGDVKIRLQMKDNLITGRIVVENNTVKEVFDHNLDDLLKAFQREGFETGNLDVFVGDDSMNGREKEGLETPFFRNKHIDEIERNSASADDMYSAEGTVNLVV
jgi:flagellar protein FlbC